MTATDAVLRNIRGMLVRAERERDMAHAALRDFIRQVEEFEHWDEGDWPMAIKLLREHSARAQAAIEEDGT